MSPGFSGVGDGIPCTTCSFTDAQIRAGTYMGGPEPPFTPGYELVGVVEEVGAGCERLKEGDRVGVLTVYGADAERVCVPEEYAVEVPEDLDPAEVRRRIERMRLEAGLLRRAELEAWLALREVDGTWLDRQARDALAVEAMAAARRPLRR